MARCLWRASSSGRELCQAVDKILLAGADKARQLATPFMHELRHAVGLRALSSGSAAPVAKESKTALPTFKQYREKDGLFYFKLVDPKGQVLLQSCGFATPKEAGQTITQLQTEGPDALERLKPVLEFGSTAEDSVKETLSFLKQSSETKQK